MVIIVVRQGPDPSHTMIRSYKQQSSTMTRGPPKKNIKLKHQRSGEPPTQLVDSFLQHLPVDQLPISKECLLKNMLSASVRASAPDVGNPVIQLLTLNSTPIAPVTFRKRKAKEPAASGSKRRKATPTGTRWTRKEGRMQREIEEVWEEWPEVKEERKEGSSEELRELYVEYTAFQKCLNQFVEQVEQERLTEAEAEEEQGAEKNELQWPEEKEDHPTKEWVWHKTKWKVEDGIYHTTPGW